MKKLKFVKEGSLYVSEFVSAGETVLQIEREKPGALSVFASINGLDKSLIFIEPSSLSSRNIFKKIEVAEGLIVRIESESEVKLTMIEDCGAQLVSGYISDGLVFWLDGIDKGGKSGKWIDLAGGVEFAPVSGQNIEWGDDYISGQVAASVPVSHPYDNSTIEAVIRNRQNVTETNLFFNCGVVGGICVGVARPLDPRVLLGQGAGYSLSYQGNVAGLFKKGGSTVSGNKNRLIVNGVVNNASGTLDNWLLRGIVAIVGASPSVNSRYEICSIRIYDRLLTEEEMRHNQANDVVRFNLVFPGANDTNSSLGAVSRHAEGEGE